MCFLLTSDGFDDVLDYRGVGMTGGCESIMSVGDNEDDDDDDYDVTQFFQSQQSFGGSTLTELSSVFSMSEDVRVCLHIFVHLLLTFV